MPFLLVGKSLEQAPSAANLLAIIEIQNAIAATALSGDAVLRLVVDRAPELVGGSGASIAVVEGDALVRRFAVGSRTQWTDERLARAGIVAECLAKKCAYLSERGSAEPDDVVRACANSGQLLWMPLVFGEHAVGLVEVHASQTLPEDAAATLALLANIVAIALHRVQAYPRAKPDELHDTLTGLGNVRAHDERVAAELGRLTRYGHGFSIALVRLTGFEGVADRGGQAAADDLLRQVTRMLGQGTRAIDACFRVAASDFVVVMPGTGLAGAQVLADRFRARLADTLRNWPQVAPRVGVVEAGSETAAVLGERAVAALA